MSTYKPLGDSVLIQIIPPAEADKPRIHAPAGSTVDRERKAEYARNVVIDVGPGRLLDNGSREPVDVAIGDVVLMRSEVASFVDKARGLVLISAQHVLTVVDEGAEYPAGVLAEIKPEAFERHDVN